MPPSAPLARVLAPAATALLAAGLLLLAGCGASSDQPLSDAASTVVDEALVGHWTCTERGWAEDRAPKAPRDLVVGRAEGGGGALEAAWVELDHDGHVRVLRLELRPTQVGARRYLSAREAGTAGEPWFLLRYERAEDGTLTLLGLDEARVAAEVEGKRIAGRVTGQGAGREVRLTAPTEALRTWVEATPGVFDPKRASRFRRLATDDE